MENISKNNTYGKNWVISNKSIQLHLIEILPSSELNFHQWLHSTDVIIKPVTWH